MTKVIKGPKNDDTFPDINSKLFDKSYQKSFYQNLKEIEEDIDRKEIRSRRSRLCSICSALIIFISRDISVFNIVDWSLSIESITDHFVSQALHYMNMMVEIEPKFPKTILERIESIKTKIEKEYKWVKIKRARITLCT